MTEQEKTTTTTTGNPIEKWSEDLKDISPKKTYGWPADT